ncbi:hypothetical protein CKO15_13435 [Halorhodospira abdelmalekii]|uniref:hypothetical protein n=1 Tax=Halorhodospira abdelmalekii TaxID=421629 RepID=UPI0019042734|nr:hypothetical protein [Halorhodospira abdelmalekii]MBK1736246.1 hypothetical protein [Halorhodospira abdelmalekii]
MDTNWLLLNGTLSNVLETPTGTNRETGERYGGQHQVQVDVWKTLRNGQQRKDTETLTVPDYRPWEPHIGEQVQVPVGVSVWNGQLRFFYAGANR